MLKMFDLGNEQRIVFDLCILNCYTNMLEIV